MLACRFVGGQVRVLASWSVLVTYASASHVLPLRKDPGTQDGAGPKALRLQRDSSYSGGTAVTVVTGCIMFCLLDYAPALSHG